MVNSMFLRAWLKWFILIFVVLTAVIIPALLQYEKDRVDIVTARQITHLIAAEKEISFVFRERLADMQVLAGAQGVRSYLTQGYELIPNGIIQLFKAVCSSYGVYDQIRLIRLDGQELFRVNHDGGQCNAVAQEKLQNKVERYYFKEAARLSSGETFISPLDLNVEHGEIEIPRKPMIRFATPAIDSNGNIKAVIVMNYLAQDLLDNLFPRRKTNLFAHHDYFDFLVNDQGYYLLSEQSPEREFAFMFGHEQESFSTDYPEVWQAALNGAGSVLTKEGLFLIKTVPVPISPLTEAIDVGDVSAASQWYLFNLITNQNLYATSVLYGPFRRAWFSFYLFIIAVISNLWAQRKLRAHELQNTTDNLYNIMNAIDHSGIDVHWVDYATGRLIFVNDNTAQLLGYTKEELLGRYVWDLEHDMTREQFPEFGSQIRDAGSMTFETIFRHKGGRAIPVEVTVSYREATPERAAHFVTFVKDISDRKESEQNLKRVQQIAHIGSWALNHVSQRVEWSEETFRIFGYSPKTFVPDYNSFVEVVHPEDLERVKQTLERSICERTPYHLEHRILTPDGKVRFIEVRAETEYDNVGHPLRTTGTVLDTTERKLAEQKSLHLHVRNKAILAAVGDGIFGVDSKDLTIYMNAAAEQMLGWTEEELRGRHNHPLIHHACADGTPYPEEECYIHKTLHSGKANRIENEIFWRKDGTSFPVSYVSTPKFEEGEITGAVVVFQDISERLAREAELKKTKEQLERAQHVAALGIWELDYVTNQLTWSDEIYAIFELNKDTFEPSYEAFLHIIHPEDRDKVSAAYERSLVTQEKYQITHRILMEDGRIKWVEEQCDTEFDEAGKPMRSFGTVYDITKQKHAEEKFKTFLELASDGVHILDTQGNVIECSQSFARALGYSYEEVRQLNVRDWDDAIHKDQLIPMIKALLECPRTFETRHKRKDGTIIDVQISTQCIEIDGRKYIYSSARDITERKQVEEHTRRLKEQLEMMFNTVPIPMILLTHDGKISYRNAAFLHVIGYGPEEAPDYETCLKKACPDEETRMEVNARWMEHVAQANSTDGMIQPDTYKIICKDGVDRPFLISGKFFSDGAIVSFVDMTDQEAAKAALVEAKELAESASAAKSDFLATTSHEIRTPLNGMIGLTKLLQQTDLNEQQRDYLAQSLNSSKTLMTVINDILDYSKIEAGKLELESSPFSLQRLLGEVTRLFKPAAEDKGVELHVESSGELPDTLEGDSHRLQQILSNLLSNAIKFSDSGTITIHVAALEEREGDLTLKFAVSDTGIGIEPDILEALFEPFTQSDASDTRKYGGTGLGLSICKRLSELMGGEIWAESQPGEGSTFYFTVVMKQSAAVLADFPDSQDSWVALKKFVGMVLVAEDNRVNQLVIQSLLKNYGCSVTLVENGQQAVDACKNNAYDLVFMDIQMPVMGGYEATRAIRAFNRDIPIIAVSAAALERDRRASEVAGMNDHLSKPLDGERMRDVLLHYLQPAKTEIAEAEEGQVRIKEMPAGFNTHAALNNLGGRTALYITLLKSLVETTPAMVTTLDACLESGDLAGAHKKFHSLKGSAATVGAEAFAAFAGQWSDRLMTEKTVADMAALRQQLHEHVRMMLDGAQVIIEELKGADQ